MRQRLVSRWPIHSIAIVVLLLIIGWSGQRLAARYSIEAPTGSSTLLLIDSDGDGVADEIDLDDDNDGILDTAEGGDTADFDGDGIPNRLDLDSDDDAIPDNHEAQLASGFLLPSGIDENGNGLDDIFEAGLSKAPEEIPESESAATPATGLTVTVQPTDRKSVV